MRWRILVNSMERTGARDTVERFSLAIEQLGPIMAIALMIPSAVALAGLAGYSGHALASDDPAPLTFEALRYMMLAASVLAVVGPMLLPIGERTNPVRLLLLPIPRNTLYISQAAATFADPWALLLIPIVLALPVGLAAGGAFGAALTALAGGVLMLAAVIGLSSLATSMIHLAVRDRRRGELLTLGVILIIPLLGMLPSVLGGSHRGGSEDTDAGAAGVPAWAVYAAKRAFASTPSELYVASTRAAVSHDVVRAAAPVIALGAIAVGLHGLGLLAFGRVLDSPASSGARRGTTMRGGRGWRLPGLSPGASAVALAQLRLAMRTPRGRSIFLSPLVVFVMLAWMMRRTASGLEFGIMSLQSGVSLASFGSFLSLLSILPLAMNQFAIDRAGLTLALLSPLSDRDYLKGKAVGNGLIAIVPAMFCVLAAAVAVPGGSAALWLCVPLPLLSTYTLDAPVAAILSAIFPRAVDLNSIGRGSNAHGAAALLGLGAFLAAGFPSVVLSFLATRVLHQPVLAPVFLAAWCLVAAVIGHLLFIPTRRIFAARRENLGLVV
jgi:hypothetical protein